MAVTDITVPNCPRISVPNGIVHNVTLPAPVNENGKIEVISSTDSLTKKIATCPII
jgi:succinyl-CoA synthetase alpha subunit